MSTGTNHRFRTGLAAAAAGAVAAAAAVLLLPLAAAVAVTAAIVLAELAVIGVLLARVAGRARNVEVRRSLDRAAAAAAESSAAAPEDAVDEKDLYHDKWAARLQNGFAATAIEPLLRTARNRSNRPEHRLRTLRTLDAWLQAEARAHDARVDHSLDVLIVSHFGLPGGNTSANVADITALTRAGFRVGLLHHPVYRWDVATPINPKIAELVDDDAVVLVSAQDSVRCDLAIVRLPTIMGRLMDELPEIEAGRTVLLVNQPPFTFYDEDGGRREQWSVRTVFETVQGWLGDHTWYTIGPAVRETLERHHGHELDGIDIADEYWYEIIDVADWIRPERRPGDRPIRIGRHARDAPQKWPDTPEAVLGCYPASPEFEVHSLGGVETPREMLGSVPDNWIDHPFGSVPVREFLHGLDVHVYFTSLQYVEAFGRSPMEAMAVGLPCIMDPRFEALFGEGALYCEPDEVESVVRKLVDEPGRYEEQVRRAQEKVEQDFSPAALVRRVIRLGASPTGGDAS
ncbi:MAG: glycosyltransferase family 4 protein [Glycomyces artemisiae]|uniref:Glycosyltransferase family 4 protein n=1 Tax=Glycomyces artemisiae TaxID=1076443 RepID=A0A850CB34_9ACTN|nr:glycosyltransferase family 4 protein [Glycomyces artemisiae]